MTGFETALDPGCGMYDRDISADTKAVHDVIAALDLSIDRIKDLLRQNAFDSNAGASHGVCRIGQLLDMRNRLTGEHKDVEYLYSDDGEFFWFVAGFVGDAAGVADSQGRPLLVGDMIAADFQGQEQKRMVILSSKGVSMFSQKWIDEHDAVFLQEFSEADMRWANVSPAYTVHHRSCLEDYHAARDRQRAQKKKKPQQMEK